MKSIITVLSGAVCVLLIGCVTPKPQVTRWYKSQEPLNYTDRNALKDTIVLRAFAPKSEPSASKKLWDLTGEGQAAYIGLLGTKTNTLPDLDAALAKPIGSAAQREIDITTFKKRIVLSVENKFAQPGDRIARLEIRLALADRSFRFVSWDKLETKYATVDLGKLTNTRGTAFEFAPGVTLGGDIIGAQAGKASSTGSLAEEQVLSRRFVDVTGILEEYQGTLILEGMPGRDLTGNIVVEVTMEATNRLTNSIQSMTGLFNGAVAQPANGIVVSSIPVIEPGGAAPVKVNIEYDACLRHINDHKSARTIQEGDDVVQLRCSHKLSAAALTLLPSEELKKANWVIEYGAFKVHLKPAAGGPPELLAFATKAGADEFLRWLNTGAANTVSNYQLTNDVGVIISAADKNAMVVNLL